MQLTSLGLPVLQTTGPGTLTKPQIVQTERLRQLCVRGNARNLLSHYLFLSGKGKYRIYINRVASI